MIEYVALAVNLLKLGHGLARSAGLIKSRTDAILSSVDGKVSVLIEAPLHEGPARLEQAAHVADARRRLALLEEARGKLTDVISRKAAAASARAYAGAALTATWHHLGEPQLALEVLERAERDLREVPQPTAGAQPDGGNRGDGTAAAAVAVGGAAAVATVLSGGLLAPLAAGAVAQYGRKRVRDAVKQRRAAEKDVASRMADAEALHEDLGGVLKELGALLRPGPRRLNGAIAL